MAYSRKFVGKPVSGERSWLKPGVKNEINRVPNDLSGEPRSVLTRKMPFLYVKRVFLDYMRKKCIRVNEGTKGVGINVYLILYE